MSLETLSHEEDNGEDPCQSIRPPSDDRERMLHLETAVAWIKQQVVRFLTSTFFFFFFFLGSSSVRLSQGRLLITV